MDSSVNTTFPTKSESVIVRCDCDVETLAIDLYAETESEPFEGYITIGTMYPQAESWRYMLKVLWTILRRKKHYFSSVILTPTDAVKVRDAFDRMVKGGVVDELTEALRLTGEYAGLPQIDGWSWYDALKKYAPEKLPSEQRQ